MGAGDGEAQLFKALFKFRAVVRRGPLRRRRERARTGKRGEGWAVEEAKQARETSSGEYGLSA